MASPVMRSFCKKLSTSEKGIIKILRKIHTQLMKTQSPIPQIPIPDMPTQTSLGEQKSFTVKTILTMLGKKKIKQEKPQNILNGAEAQS